MNQTEQLFTGMMMVKVALIGMTVMEIWIHILIHRLMMIVTIICRGISDWIENLL
ncbi:hypothetical protein AAAU52_12565 [Blautia hansenii]|uniref:hypothetical protein n=1 Tax=Blautia hansenii TaxID=1322 RepID=UPI00140414FD